MRGHTSKSLAILSRFFAVLGLAIAAIVAGGCDPASLTRGAVDTRRGALAVPIIESLDALDKPEKEFSEAQDVRNEDLKVIAADYVIGRNDQLTVSIYELVNANVETVRTVRVSESGMISLPLLNDQPVKAAGLTEAQLQQAIVKKYRDNNIFGNAQVSVQVNEARQRTFSLLGSVNRPGQYVIVDSNFRIFDALVLANGASYEAEYLYVVRRLESERPSTRPADDIKSPRTTTDPLAPHSKARDIASPVLAQVSPDPLAPTGGSASRRAASAPTRRSSDDPERYISIDGQARTLGATRPGDAALGAAPSTRSTPAGPPAAENKSSFNFSEPVPDQDTRIIRVPLQALMGGDLRYNIIVRPYDTIIVPPPMNGQYFMGGHIARPGAYVLPPTSRLTLMQAVVGAGMLDATAIPQRTDIIRRINKDKAIFVRVDMAKVFAGEMPDIYLRPNDIVMVGTHEVAPYWAAIRNAFRFTYGFGFTYDRNFYTGSNSGLGL